MKNFLLALSLVIVSAPIFADAALEVEQTLVRSEEEAAKVLAEEAATEAPVTEQAA